MPAHPAACCAAGPTRDALATDRRASSLLDVSFRPRTPLISGSEEGCEKNSLSCCAAPLLLESERACTPAPPSEPIGLT